ncbi:uncharacterized protein MONOS_18430 [Monocercomonoides exilis]|uniref:uncharacterized protein n=1 Tax=Monocercomonoides exilis TaxID=2049356 RepID=UPI0035596937|nr:hypothetical protein MONOS_18430 [Monocercomonoides exilis]
MTGTVTHARMWPNGVSIGPVVAEKSERLVVLSSVLKSHRKMTWGLNLSLTEKGVEWRISVEGLMGRAGKGHRASSSEAGFVLGLWLSRPCGLAWLYLTYTVFPQNSGVGARAPETKVTVCAQTVAARWAGCCWAPVYPSGWVAWLMWAEWACGQWLQGWVVGVWLGWLAERWCVGGRAPETKVTVQRGTRAVQWAGSGLWAVGWAGLVGCALEIHYENGMSEKPALILKVENYTTPMFSWRSKILSMKFLYEKYTVDPHVHRLIAPQGQVSETSRCHRGHANGAVGWACPAGTMWHTFGWWAVAGPRAVPEKVRIWESSRCHRETRSTLALSIGAIAIEILNFPISMVDILDPLMFVGS